MKDNERDAIVIVCSKIRVPLLIYSHDRSPEIIGDGSVLVGLINKLGDSGLEIMAVLDDKICMSED